MMDYHRLAFDVELDVRRSWAQDLALIWHQNLSKKIVLRASPIRAHLETLGLFTKVIRIRHTDAYFLELHQACSTASHHTMDAQYQEMELQDECNFDSDKHPRQWQWKFSNKDGEDWLNQQHETSFSHIEITLAK
jgi:hypothetical protein